MYNMYCSFITKCPWALLEDKALNGLYKINVITPVILCNRLG